MPYVKERKLVEQLVEVRFIQCSKCGHKQLESTAAGWMHVCEMKAISAGDMLGQIFGRPPAADDEKHLCPACAAPVRALLLVH